MGGMAGHSGEKHETLLGKTIRTVRGGGLPPMGIPGGHSGPRPKAHATGVT